MNIFNGSNFADSAPSTYGFDIGHVFGIVTDAEEVLYEYLSHDKHVLTAKPVANPALTQVFRQEDIRSLVTEGRLDPRVEENSVVRQRILARNPDISSVRDLPDDELAELSFYLTLCQRIHQMRIDHEISLTDRSLDPAIRRVMAELVFNLQDGGHEDPPKRSSGKSRGEGDLPAARKIDARKKNHIYKAPKPSTLRGWLRTLIDHEWDILALRDHRKGRVGYHAPKITEPVATSIMAAWVQAYLDRARPTKILLYKLMVGTMELPAVNQARNGRGQSPLAVRDAPSFAEVNASRLSEGLPPLNVPSLSTFQRATRKLDKFSVVAARYGAAAARKQFKIAGKREVALAPGQRVTIDCWRTQLLSLKLPGEFWTGLPQGLSRIATKLRLSVAMAIDEATRVIMGVRLSVNPDSDTAIRTLEMVCRDKTAIAIAAGCNSTWHHACTPETVPTDSGSEFIDWRFTGCVRDIGAGNEIGPAKHPDARGVQEKAFQTLDSQVLPFFQGRTFAGVDDKGDYDAGAFANVLAETLGRHLVRYIVDEYHNSPHNGLGGQTPNDAWTERSSHYKLIPPPRPNRLRTVFGFASTRRIQNRGIRFFGLYYRSDKLARLRLKVGQANVRIRVDLANLKEIWVSATEPGSEWIAVGCDIDMGGISLAVWLKALGDLQRKYAHQAKLKEHIVLAAVRDRRAEALRSAEDAGIGPSTMSTKDLLCLEIKTCRHFYIEPAGERGHAFDDMDADALHIEDQAGGEPNEASQNEEAFGSPSDRPVVRRRGQLGSDFLKEDKS